MLTAGTFLVYKTSSGKYTFDSSTTKYDILVDITEYPDLDSEAKAEDNTTLSVAKHTYEPGLPDSGGSLAFPCNFNDADYTRVKALEGEVLQVAVVFGGKTQEDGMTIDPTGATIELQTNARVQYRRTSGSAGDVRKAEVDVYPTTDKATYPKNA